MRKLFGNYEMNWKRLIVFSLIAGIYTALINCVPFLSNTSFQDIAITYEWWVVFALIIVTNCRKPLEAGLKCFVFFLISQPLVYLVEAVLGKITLDDGIRFYRQMWMFMTVLTLPGGFIAWYAKKDNFIGSLILGIGDAIILMMGVHFTYVLAGNFPYHLLSAVFCFVCSIMLPLFIIKSKKYQTVAILVSYLLTGAVTLYALANHLAL